MQTHFSYYFFLLIFGFSFQNCQNSPSKPIVMAKATPSVSVSLVSEMSFKTLKIKGLSFVAPPRPFKVAPMMDVKAVNADWIAVIPYAFTRPGEADVHYKTVGSHWWGETVAGVQTTIDSAHKAGIHVMLKPQVYVPNGWTGGLDFSTDAEWAKWEEGYEKYILPFAAIADSMRTEMFCIGTEFKIGVVKREAFWRNLIAKVRKIYHGKLVYAANWDEYPNVPFWDALDCVGVNAYFPLVQKDTPSVSELKLAWKPIFEALKKFHEKTQKPILFTEFGYLSADGCAYNSWEVEKRIHETKINELAQANALEGLFSTFWNEDWWCGGFLWKWFPEGQGHEGYMNKDYTPQGKMGQKTLTKWYGK